MPEKVTSEQIKTLLEDRHRGDVFYTEVKTGESFGRAGSLHILDAWAMKISWAHPLVIGYEIKVSRSDFMQDNKWPQYLPFCNEFYFVCPHGLIEKRELPKEVGLIYVSKNGKMLRRISKAAHRSIEIPESILRYLLFYRARTNNPQIKSVDEWKAFLKRKADKYSLGRACSKKIQKDLEELKEIENQNYIDKSTLDQAKRILVMYEEITGHDLLKNASRFGAGYAQRVRLERSLAGTGPEIVKLLKDIQGKVEGLIQKEEVADER